VNLAAQDVQGNQAVAQAVIPVELLTLKRKRYQIKNDMRYEYFSLILFDYDKADLKPIHQRILDIVKSRVEPSSQVYIEGYADRTGTPEYNRQLAKRRCLSVQQYLEPAVRKDQIHIRAVGSDELLYNNDLPDNRRPRSSPSRAIMVPSGSIKIGLGMPRTRKYAAYAKVFRHFALKSAVSESVVPRHWMFR